MLHCSFRVLCRCVSIGGGVIPLLDIPLLDVFLRPFLAAPTDRSFAGSDSATSDDVDSSGGLVVGVGRRKARFVRYPDGEFRAVDADFDRSVFDDPDSIPKAEQRSIHASILDVPNTIHTDDREHDPDAVGMIAEAMLTARPHSLVAVAQDAKGRVRSATITPAHPHLTLAVFRSSMRSLPEQTKQVTFAAGRPIPADIRNAVSEVADVELIRVAGFLVLDFRQV